MNIGGVFILDEDNITLIIPGVYSKPPSMNRGININERSFRITKKADIFLISSFALLTIGEWKGRGKRLLDDCWIDTLLCHEADPVQLSVFMPRNDPGTGLS